MIENGWLELWCGGRAFVGVGVAEMGDDYISYLCGCSPMKEGKWINWECHAGNKCWLKEAILSSCRKFRIWGECVYVIKRGVTAMLGGEFCRSKSLRHWYIILLIGRGGMKGTVNNYKCHWLGKQSSWILVRHGSTVIIIVCPLFWYSYIQRFWYL